MPARPGKKASMIEIWDGLVWIGVTLAPSNEHIVKWQSALSSDSIPICFESC